MNYFITGGTGFIGTHLTKLLKEVHPEANIYNLDIVEPGTPLPAVKGHYRSPLKEGETLGRRNPAFQIYLLRCAQAYRTGRACIK